MSNRPAHKKSDTPEQYATEVSPEFIRSMTDEVMTEVTA